MTTFIGRREFITLFGGRREHDLILGTKFERGWNLGSGTGVRWPCLTFPLIRSCVSALARG